MSEVKKHIIHRSKKRTNLKKRLNQKVVFITQTEASVTNTLFPEKLKNVNKLLEKTTFLSE